MFEDRVLCECSTCGYTMRAEPFSWCPICRDDDGNLRNTVVAKEREE